MLSLIFHYQGIRKKDKTHIQKMKNGMLCISDA
jgi:hypothetical protein